MALMGITQKDFPDPRNRIVWLDWLKFFATIAVIVTHVASIGWALLPPTTSEWMVTSVFEIASRFCVPSFFFATGAFLCNPNKHVSTKRLMHHYVGRTLGIALIVSFFFCLLQALVGTWNGWRALLRATLDGPYFIWYLWALICVYLLLPLLRVIVSHPKLLTYALLVLLVTVIVKSTVVAMIPDSALALVFNNLLVFPRGAEAVFYVLLGAWYISHDLSLRASFGVMIAGVLAVIAAIYLNYVHACTVAVDSYYVARDNIFICLFSLGIIELVKRIYLCVPMSKPIKTISNLGLFIYLIHPFIRLLMECYAPAATSLLVKHPLVGNIVVVAMIYAMSIAIALLIRSVARTVLRKC